MKASKAGSNHADGGAGQIISKRLASTFGNGTAENPLHLPYVDISWFLKTWGRMTEPEVCSRMENQSPKAFSGDLIRSTRLSELRAFQSL